MIAVLGGGNLLLFIKFLIERHDKKKEENSELGAINKTLLKLEKDGLRTQMLLMILLRPKEKKEILTLGERYFSEPPKGLGANWYMTDIFNNWLTSEGHSKPEWFDNKRTGG